MPAGTTLARGPKVGADEGVEIGLAKPDRPTELDAGQAELAPQLADESSRALQIFGSVLVLVCINHCTTNDYGGVVMTTGNDPSGKATVVSPVGVSTPWLAERQSSGTDVHSDHTARQVRPAARRAARAARRFLAATEDITRPPRGSRQSRGQRLAVTARRRRSPVSGQDRAR
jgi:hypothetical protein